MRLQFTATAMRRPGIFRDTLQSFAANLRGVDFRASELYLNIDPLPAQGDIDLVLEIAGETFGHVFSNAPETPSFPAAVKWCWSQPTDELFVHLEDDWLLQRPVEIWDMLALMRADPSLSLVNLRAYKHSDDRLCLAPGLWRTEHAKAIAARMRTDANPEMQLRAQRPSNPYGGLHNGFKGKQFPAEIVIRDIGRAWMQVNSLRRDSEFNGNRNQFTRWVTR